MLAYAIVMTVAAFLFLTGFVLLAWKSGSCKRLSGKTGFRGAKEPTDRSLLGWSNMLEKMDYSPDIVFFGDCLIKDSDFRFAFPSEKIVNLGYAGDTLEGMLRRVSMVKALSPKKVFLLGGIHGLKNKGAESSIEAYGRLLDRLLAAVPTATVYVQGLPPVSRAKERKLCSNKTIRDFNEGLCALAFGRGCPFIDLYSLYEKDGEIDPTLSADGLHLRESAYARWATKLAPFLASGEGTERKDLP